LFPNEIHGLPAAIQTDPKPTDRLWEIRDLVQMLEDWEAQRDNEPDLDVDMHKVDGKPFCAGDVPGWNRGNDLRVQHPRRSDPMDSD